MSNHKIHALAQQLIDNDWTYAEVQKYRNQWCEIYVEMCKICRVEPKNVGTMLGTTGDISYFKLSCFNNIFHNNQGYNYFLATKLNLYFYSKHVSFSAPRIPDYLLPCLSFLHKAKIPSTVHIFEIYKQAIEWAKKSFLWISVEQKIVELMTSVVSEYRLEALPFPNTAPLSGDSDEIDTHLIQPQRQQPCRREVSLCR